MNRPLVWANYPGEAEIDRAVAEAFRVTRAHEQIVAAQRANPWKDWEDDILVKHYGNSTIEEFRRKLSQRSINEIKGRAIYLGLHGRNK